MSGHFIHFYACGKCVKSQCRCPGDKVKTVLPLPCPNCRPNSIPPATEDDLKRDNWEELFAWVNNGDSGYRGTIDQEVELGLFRLAHHWQQEAEELAKDVREWLCRDCHTVYPGPPQPGFNCVVCPKCEGWTAPRMQAERARYKAKAESAGYLLERAIDGSPFKDRITTLEANSPSPATVARVLREAAKKVREECKACNGSGYGSHPDDPNPYECEYCGRPMKAIEAMIPESERHGT